MIPKNFVILCIILILTSTCFVRTNNDWIDAAWWLARWWPQAVSLSEFVDFSFPKFPPFPQAQNFAGPIEYRMALVRYNYLYFACRSPLAKDHQTTLEKKMLLLTITQFPLSAAPAAVVHFLKLEKRKPLVQIKQFTVLIYEDVLQFSIKIAQYVCWLRFIKDPNVVPVTQYHRKYFIASAVITCIGNIAYSYAEKCIPQNNRLRQYFSNSRFFTFEQFIQQAAILLTAPILMPKSPYFYL